MNGALTVDITGGGNEDAALLIDGNGDFFLDEDGNQALDLNEESGAVADLRQIIVNGTVGIGSFLWRGDFTASNSLSVLIQNVNASTIEATTNVTTGNLLIEATGINSDLQINSALGAANQNITLRATDSVLFGATGSATITGAGNVSVIANSDGLNGNGLDEIFMADGARIQVGTGSISLNASGNFGGNITLGNLIANTNAGTAINISATGSIVDGTALDAIANASATNGRIVLSAGSGGIGAAEDIDINSLRLGFNTTGSIGITDLAGGINVDSVSTAGGGGFLAANSPLTISANVTVGASTVFTAGNSAALNDDILINNNAIVALTGTAADSTLTFNAGDDIVFDTGTIVATEVGRNHTVFLNADVEGAADADRGSITNVAAAGVTISASRLELAANDGIGDSIGDAGTFAGVALRTSVDTLVATNTTRGDILIQETNGLIIAGTGVRTLAGNGNINIDVDAGNLTVNSVVTANGAGNVTLNADAGTIALNAAVSSTTGSITITGDAIDQNAGGNISTGGAGTVTATADNGNITMADGTTTTTATGTIGYSATGNVALSQLISTSGALNVTADSDTNGTGSISDNAAAETANLTTTGTATLSAAQGIGATAAADIDTTIGTLVATNSTTGDIFIQETAGLIIAGTGVRTLAGNGNINIDVDAGNLTVNSVVTANGAGNVTLNADAGTIALNAAVSSTTGSITITGDAIDQNAGGNISTGGAGTVTATADNGSITMADGTTTTTATGTIGYTATGNVALSQLISTSGALNVTADSDTNGTGSISDNTAAETANLTTTGTATLSAAQGIGAAAAADIDTTIGTLVATNSTTGDIFIQETAGLIIAGTGVRTLAGNGNINIDVDAGNLTVNSVVTANGAGNVTLNADAGTIALNAAVSSTTGSITITGDAIDQNAGGNISTGGAGTVTATADNGSITMADGTTTTTATGTIGYTATGNVALSQLISTSGALNVTADSDTNGTGSISDNTAAETANLTTTGTATLSAAQGIGAAAAADIDTTIGTLVATNSTTGDIFIQETAGLIIAGTGVRTLAGNGNINIDVDAGNLTVNSVVTANGAGNVTLNADAGTITLNAAVSSTTGSIEITGDAIDQNATGDISTGGAGTVLVIADNGGITMIDGALDSATTNSANGTITYNATGTVALSLLNSSAGDVLVSGSNITDNDGLPDNLDVQGVNVTLTALPGSIGSTSTSIFRENINAIEVVATGNLVASATNGLIALDATVTGTVTLTANTAWVESTGDLNVVGAVFTVTNLALIADSDSDGNGTLTLDNAVNVLGDLRVEGADIVAADGSIDLLAARLMVYSGQSEILNVTTGQLDATTRGDLTVLSSAAIELIDLGKPYFDPPVDRDNVALQTLTNNGSIRVEAAGTITVTDDVIAGNDLIQTSTGSITLISNVVNGNIVVNDLVLSDAGVIRLEAFNDIIVGTTLSPNENVIPIINPVADTDNLVVITTTSGNITLVADSDNGLNGASGSITMADGTRIIAGRDTTNIYDPGIDGTPSPSTISLGAAVQTLGNAQIRLTADGTITVGSLQSANNDTNAIYVQSFNSAIVDAGDTTLQANFVANNVGARVVLQAVSGIGSSDALETQVYSLSALNTTGVLPAAPTGAIRVQEIAGGGDLRLVEIAPGSQSIRNDAIGGDIAIRNLIGELLIEADVLANDGNVSLQAATNVLQNADVTTGGAGTVTVTADNGNITMADGTTTTSATGSINYSATGNVALSVLTSTSGALNVTADSDANNTGSITDNTALETANLVTTGTATLLAAQGIGAAGAADIDTTIGTLVATNSTSGDIFIQESNDLIIGGTGVRTLGGNGNIDIDVDAGNLNVNSVVTANGSGNVTLNADAGTIALAAIVSSTTGSIAITGDTVNQNADVLTGGAGAVTVTADNGNITMADGTTTTSATGSISYSASGNVALSLLTSTSGALNVTADSDANNTGSITDNTAGESANLVTTGTATLLAAQGIGAAGAADIDTTIGTLVATNSTSGDIFIQESNDLIIGGTGVRTLGGNGNINIDVDAGNLNVNSVVTANGSGNVTLNADAGTIALAAVVSSTTGSIAITGDTVNQNADVLTGGAGAVTVTADNGNITMADGTTTTSATGSINYSATGNVALSLLTSTSGALNVTADSDGNNTGSITDNTALESANLVTTGTATLVAAQGIGAAGTADIDTTIGTLVATNSTSGDIFIQESNDLIIGGTGVRTLGGNGNINIDVDAGNLNVNSVVTANGSGNVTLNADAGTIALAAVVSSTTGSIAITGDTVNQNADVLTGGAGTVTVTADNGNITMADGTTTTSATGSINYSATGNVALSLLTSTSGALNVTADSDANNTGSITDNTAGESANLVTTGTATLLAAQGIGAAGAADIDTTIGTLVATNSTSGDIFIQESNDLIIGGTGVRTLGGNGNINIDVDAGNLNVNSVVTANGSGNVTLNADAGTIALAAVVSSTTGSIAITGDTVNQNAGGNITTGGAGTVSVTADNGNITMADGTSTTSATGSINYSATGNVALSLLTSTSGALNVTADSDANNTGSITDNTAGESANLVTTGTATLVAAQGIGAAGAADIDTTIGTLVATNSTSGDIFIQESNDLIIGGTGVRTLGGNGNINIDVDAGNLNVNSVVTANGSGNATLNADAGTIALAATVSSTTGSILITGDTVNQNAGGNITTGGAGTVSVTADNGNITMADGTSTTSATGSINYSATGNVALSLLTSTSGALNVTADSDANNTGSITDNTAGESANLVTTGTATLVAAQGIGAAGAADIDTTIGTLVATNSTSGDIFIQESNDLIIGGTGVRTLGGNGNINIDVDAGNLNVNSVVTANGSGNVTLNADAGTIALAAVVSSTTGSIAITGDTVNQNADVLTGGAGAVTVTADNGNITMADGTTTTSATGSISYSASGNVALSLLTSTSGALNVTADSDANNTGSIIDNTAGESANLVTTGTATLVAAQGIGAAGAADIDTTIRTLVATNSTSGDIFIQESNDLIIGSTGVRTLGGNGNINIDVDAGNLNVNSVVNANGLGNVTLIADAGWIDEGSNIASIEGNRLTIKAGQYAHLSNTNVNFLAAEVGSNGLLNSLSTGIDWQKVNSAAADRGDDFLANLRVGLRAVYTGLSNAEINQLVNDFKLQYETRYANQYALFLVNQKALTVTNVSAGTSANPNVYIETDRASNLTIDGVVKTTSNVADEGGVVLVAGGEFVVTSQGKLETTAVNANPTQVVYSVPDPRFVNALNFFDGGLGVPGRLSTLEVLNAFNAPPSFALETPTRHFFQQVALNFGFTSPVGSIDAGSNENGFVVFVGYADGEASPFLVANKPLDTQLFTRATLFDSAFLQENQQLPTNAIVRRANDFFIFENASRIDGTENNDALTPIRDLTFQYESIDNVISGGNGGGVAIPPNLLPPIATVLVSFSVPTVLPNVVFQPQEVELEFAVEKPKSVAIYFVEYEDGNKDGQPDLNELPPSDKIVKGLDNETGVKPESIAGADGGSPTPQEIEIKKDEFLRDPSKPSGVYAIVEKTTDGKVNVLDVFPVRDSEPKVESNTEPTIVPDTTEPAKLEDFPPTLPTTDSPKTDTTFIVPSLDRGDSMIQGVRDANLGGNSSTRFATGGLLFGSLWLVRESSKSNKSSIEATSEPIEGMGTVGYSSRDRRNRRLRSILGE